MTTASRLTAVLRRPSGAIGVSVAAAMVVLAVAGPPLAPHPIDQPIGPPGTGPSPGAPLGTDFLGRDVLSRTLSGGASVLGLSLAAIALTYAVGGAIGLTAGYRRSLVDPLLMRMVDVMLAFPPLLLVLVLVSGAGSSVMVLILGVALVLAPGVARITRTATLVASRRGYVEAAVARGERAPAVAIREILPNIAAPLIADLGVRFGYGIVLIASVNYLGLGLKPPAADWGLMVAENRELIGTNPLSVVVPALLLGVLVVSVNLVGDSYVRSRGHFRQR